MHPETLTKTFPRLVREVGLPRLRFHDLRHLSASLQLDAGVPPVVVSKQHGHANMAITMDLYSHLIGSVGRDSAAKTSDLLTRYLEG
jgi:integrase